MSEMSERLSGLADKLATGPSVTKTHPNRIWHLLRGREQCGPISEREVHLLAELGRLEASDFLWTPGFSGWRQADSIPGILIPPRLPNSVSSLDRIATTAKGGVDFYREAISIRSATGTIRSSPT
jgi:hypothetical protein